MLVLGKSSDDKGTQLEKLTHTLLSAMGYTNIVINEIRSGGEEIDLRADYEFQSVGGRQTSRLICECKAHKEPSRMSDWLKFLGKILSEEIRQGCQIHACFIALGGINGNVSGHYSDIKSRRVDIALVTGEALFEHVTRLFNVCNLEAVNNTVRRFTDRQIRSVEIAYYEERVFWVVILEEGAYTFLGANGDLLEGDVTEELKPLIESVLAATPYINLREEAEASRRAIRVAKAVLSDLIINDGSSTFDAISVNNDEFTEEELKQIVADLEQQDLVVQSGSGTDLYLPQEDDAAFYEKLIGLYRFLLAGEITLPMITAITSPYYINHINEELIARIQEIQGNIPLSLEEIRQARYLLKWSPTALAWALHPDEMIVNHRAETHLSNETFKRDSDSFCRNFFLRKLYTFFKNDFRRAVLRPIFYNVHKLREIETRETVLIKSATCLVLQGDIRERLSIGQLGDGYVGPDGSDWILMSALDSTPEPWEERNKLDDESSRAKTITTPQSTDA
jgi:hypothetical protein